MQWVADEARKQQKLSQADSKLAALEELWKAAVSGEAGRQQTAQESMVSTSTGFQAVAMLLIQRWR